MNRRTLLKSLMASPLLGLFKSRKSEGLTVDKLLECKKGLMYKKHTTGGASSPCCRKEFYETTDTSIEYTSPTSQMYKAMAETTGTSSEVTNTYFFQSDVDGEVTLIASLPGKGNIHLSDGRPISKWTKRSDGSIVVEEFPSNFTYGKGNEKG